MAQPACGRVRGCGSGAAAARLGRVGWRKGARGARRGEAGRGRGRGGSRGPGDGPRTTTATLRSVLGERGRLPAPGAALGRQLLFQMVVLALQPLDLAFQAVDLSLLAVVVDLAVALAPRKLCAESVELALQVLVRIAVPGLHAKVMPDRPRRPPELNYRTHKHALFGRQEGH